MITAINMNNIMLNAVQATVNQIWTAQEGTWELAMRAAAGEGRTFYLCKLNRDNTSVEGVEVLIANGVAEKLRGKGYVVALGPTEADGRVRFLTVSWT